MATHYTVPAKSARKEDGFSQVVHEAAEHFQTRHMSIFGPGCGEIFQDSVIFEDYADRMLVGAAADEENHLRQLYDNCRFVTLHESVEGIQPIASLRVPLIRQLWTRTPVKNVFPTEVVKTPRFTVTFMKPYIVGADGTKRYLPDAISTVGSTGYNLVKGRKLYTGLINIADFNPGGGTVDGLAKGFSFITTVNSGVTVVQGVDKLDMDFRITHASVKTINNVGSVGAAQTRTIQLPLQLRPGVNGALTGLVTFYDARDLDADGETPLDGAVAYTDRIFGYLDPETCVLTLTSQNAADTNNKVMGVKVDGKFSAEMNNVSVSVGFDTEGRDVQIGVGDHINAPLTSEFLQDTMAMYQIDGVVKVTDIMTNVYELMLEGEMNAFIESVYESQADKVALTAEFDCLPPSTFAGSPREWREMLKDTVEHLAVKLRQSRRFQSGSFVVVGNELDVKMLPNVAWTFTAASGNERGGIEVDYIIGAVSGGSLRFNIVGTANLPQGTIWVFFVSSNPDEITMKYFPYVYQLERTGYQDPNNPNVPAIMMSKRHALQNFVSACAKVTIVGNTGSFGGSST
jgi:hypothetical protein